MYVKIIGEDTHYNVLLEPFTTQHGKNAVRFIGDEIPTTNKGFMLYDDNDTEIGDLSRYKYEYRQNEYSDEQDTQELPRWTDAPIKPSAVDKQISNLSSRISAITPTTFAKQAYIGDTACEFITDMVGDITAYVIDENGNYIQCTITRETGKITILFDPLETVATVNISIQ